MFRVFSKKRRQSTLPEIEKANLEEKTGFRFYRILIYSSGEIAITVVGILIALWVNNWNEERQQNQQFYNQLPKVYNEVLRQNQSIESYIYFNQNQLEILDSLLRFPELLGARKSLYYTALFCIEFEAINGQYKIMENIQKLQPNPERQDQTELNKLIVDVWSSDFQFLNNRRLKKLFEDNHFPVPDLSVYLSTKTRPEKMVGDFFSEHDIKSFDALRKTQPFINALKTEKGNLTANISAFSIHLNNGLQAMKAIKAFRPDVKASFEEIGIVGDAIGSWDKSRPMRLKPGSESTWELEATLKNGYVKFRSHNTWEENWGGYRFPMGKALKNGDDIPVQAGRYHIQLNLVTGMYSFTSLDDKKKASKPSLGKGDC